MKTIAEQMSFYGAYHRAMRNRLTHFIGVPAIMFATFVGGWVAQLIGYYFEGRMREHNDKQRWCEEMT